MSPARLPPLLDETLNAAIAMAVLSIVIAVSYWLLTGESPWPILILAEIAGFGFGVAVLALTSPRRQD